MFVTRRLSVASLQRSLVTPKYTNLVITSCPSQDATLLKQFKSLSLVRPSNFRTFATNSKNEEDVEDIAAFITPLPLPNLKNRTYIPEELIQKRREKEVYRATVDPNNGLGEVDPEFEQNAANRDQNLKKFHMTLPTPRQRKVFQIKSNVEDEGAQSSNESSSDNANVASSASGGRKTSKANVIIQPGKGEFFVNQRPFYEYFPRLAHRQLLLDPFIVTELLGRFDAHCSVSGGGVSGQAGAIRLGIARALQNWDPELRPVLKKAGLLERDERVVERKKYGQPKARKKFQWSKR